MLKIEKFVTMSPEQWEIVIEGMRNPKNSWDRMDSYMTYVEDPETHVTAPFEFFVGENDMKLMENLADGGPVHAKYRRMMPVWVTINAPLYWWKEFDTYKVGTVCNSCSTMHKLTYKEFELADFSCGHLLTDRDLCWSENIMAGPECISTPADILVTVIDALNTYRYRYFEIGRKLKNAADSDEAKRLADMQKDIWWQMIQLLPTSYNQKRTIMLTYEVLCNMRFWRKNHKLDEWHTFCDWIEELPYCELITGEKKDAGN